MHATRRGEWEGLKERKDLERKRPSPTESRHRENPRRNHVLSKGEERSWQGMRPGKRGGLRKEAVPRGG